MSIDEALIHRVRVVSRAPAGPGVPRDEQGSRQNTSDAPTYGPWVDARVMEYRGPAMKAQRGATTQAARVERDYDILLATVDQVGGDFAAPSASAVLQTECDVLGDPTIVLDSRAEILTDGTEVLGYRAFGTVVSDGA